MKNKNLYIGLGVLAVAGIGFYLWKKKQEVPEEKANATGFFNRVKLNPKNTPNERSVPVRGDVMLVKPKLITVEMMK